MGTYRWCTHLQQIWQSSCVNTSDTLVLANVAKSDSFWYFLSTFFNHCVLSEDKQDFLRLLKMDVVCWIFLKMDIVVCWIFLKMDIVVCWIFLKMDIVVCWIVRVLYHSSCQTQNSVLYECYLLCFKQVMFL